MEYLIIHTPGRLTCRSDDGQEQGEDLNLAMQPWTASTSDSGDDDPEGEDDPESAGSEPDSGVVATTLPGGRGD